MLYVKKASNFHFCYHENCLTKNLFSEEHKKSGKISNGPNQEGAWPAG